MPDLGRVPDRAPAPRGSISEIEPYVVGRPATNPAGGLASNESPFGPSPLVEPAVARAARDLHRYPDPLATRLRSALAVVHDVDPETILVGNGADELIYLLVLAYASAGGSVVCADPAYRLDEVVPRIMGASLTGVPLVGWEHDLTAMADVEADIAFVCNPHNPTGTALGREAILAFAGTARSRLVVVDEAYVDFSDDPDRMSVIGHAGGPLAVLRTFSKIHGLAGARVGYLVGSPEIVQVLRKIRPPFSVGALAQAAAEAALRDTEHREAVRRGVREGRERLSELFETAGYRVVPSQANFVLVLAEDPDVLVGRLAASGVSVRPGSNLGIPGAIRVSVPSEEGFALLERALS